jgi:parallel beta-helix repeat protein
MSMTGLAFRSYTVVNMLVLAASPTLAPVLLARHAAATERPGPSADLFKTPYYACNINFYVSTIGSDINSGTSQAAAWQTLQHANNALAANGSNPGTCINVVASGVPYAGVSLTTGGNAASRNGYLAWRCTALLGCTISPSAGPNGNDEFIAEGPGVANYTFIDGFRINGNRTVYNVGVQVDGGCCGETGRFGSHHFWVVNSSIHGNGQGGIGFATEDYTYAIHNEVSDNASAPSCDNGAQGSGIGDNVALDIGTLYPGYVPTQDDKVNPVFGSFMTPNGAWFHKAYMWNIVFNNHLQPCSASGGDTDGNGIILDTFGTRSDGTGNTVPYPDQTLIAFNVVYNTGGVGIHVFDSEWATVANNTVYQSGMDPYKSGGSASIDTNGSYGNTLINNIAVALPAANNGTCSWNAVPPYQDFDNAILGGNFAAGHNPTGTDHPDVFSNNITWLGNGNPSCWGVLAGIGGPTGENPMFNIDTYSATTNKEATDPLWVNVAGTSLGTMTDPPKGRNFALKPGSPAIGYGLTEPYLPPQSVDVGACSSKLKHCP